MLQTGLAGSEADERAPDAPRDVHERPPTATTLAAGQDELRVPLTWTDGKGVTVTKTFVFQRSMYAIDLEYSDRQRLRRRRGRLRRTRASCARIRPSSARCSRSRASRSADRRSTTRTARSTSKLNIEKSEDQTLSIDVTNGWLAGMQHHFVSAIVPDPAAPYTFTLRRKGREYLLGALGRPSDVAPGATATFKETLFVGPKLQKQLETLHPELEPRRRLRRAHLPSRPLFWLLDYAHACVKNWGLAIILVTFLLKLLFYPLSREGRPLDGAHARARAAHEGAAGNLQGRSQKLGQRDDGAVQARRR